MPPAAVAAIPILGVLAVIAGATLLARRRGYNVGSGRTIVRCMDGHLFTTIWIPGGSLKAMRLGFFRLQRCPVGNHVPCVHPVKVSDLTEEERWRAEQIHDGMIP